MKPATLAIKPTAVIIDGYTFTNGPNAGEQVVTVDGNVFTINPSAVIGLGTTIERPASVGGVFAPTPVSTVIDGLSVVVNKTLAVIDDTTMTIPATASTTVIRGRTVTLGPGGVMVATKTINVTTSPLQTSVFIAGGELLTAIGQSVVVVEGQTLTYGPGRPPKVTAVDDDTFTIGPMGVTLHGTAVGGPSARMTGTEYEIVGGATITEIGVSVVVIREVTYTVGPGAPLTTTVVGGETITIGPEGVVISTLTLPYPFGPTMTITPMAGAAAGAGQAQQTGDKKDAGASLRPAWGLSLFFTCIAIGVRVLGLLF